MITITDWIEACCAIAGVILGIIGIIVTLPKLGKKIDNISLKLLNRRSNACKNCSYKNICDSPYIEDVGDFDKKNEIDDQEIVDGIVKLYEEIEKYNFNREKFLWSKEHQECLLRKLTMSINLIGSVNMSFNRLKNEDEIIAKRK